MADEKIIDLRKVLKRNQLSYDYNNKILEKYKEINSVSDPTELAEAQRRLENTSNNIKELQAQLKEPEDAKQMSQEGIDASESQSSETTNEDSGTTEETIGSTATSSTSTTTGTTTSSTTGSTTTTTVSGTSVLPSNVTLKGSFEEGMGTIILNIDLKTGKVTGKVSASNYLEGIKTSWNGNLIGNINLESLEITGTGEGVVAYQYEGGEGTGTLDCTFGGLLNNDGTYANGSMVYTENWYGYTHSNTINWHASR